MTTVGWLFRIRFESDAIFKLKRIVNVMSSDYRRKGGLNLQFIIIDII